jgi:hypothetical protein
LFAGQFFGRLARLGLKALLALGLLSCPVCGFANLPLLVGEALGGLAGLPLFVGPFLGSVAGLPLFTGQLLRGWRACRSARWSWMACSRACAALQ